MVEHRMLWGAQSRRQFAAHRSGRAVWVDARMPPFPSRPQKSVGDGQVAIVSSSSPGSRNPHISPSLAQHLNIKMITYSLQRLCPRGALALLLLALLAAGNVGVVGGFLLRHFGGGLG